MASWYYVKDGISLPQKTRVWAACRDGELEVRAALWNGNQFVFRNGHVYGVYAYAIRIGSSKPKAPANKGWFKAGE